MTCPGCNAPMERAGVMGMWFEPVERFRAAYTLCARCSTTVAHGTEAEKKAMTGKIELAVRLAEASPSVGVH